MERKERFLGEYKAELALILSSTDIVSRSLFKALAEESAEVYILCREAGGSVRLAFFSQLVHTECKYLINLKPLVYAGYSTLTDEKEEVRQSLASGIVLSQLIAKMATVRESLRESIQNTHPYTKRFLHEQRIQGIYDSLLLSTPEMIAKESSLASKLRISSRGIAYSRIVLPVLLGFSESIEHEDEIIRSEALDWNSVEDITCSIALLSQAYGELKTQVTAKRNKHSALHQLISIVIEKTESSLQKLVWPQPSYSFLHSLFRNSVDQLQSFQA